MDRFSLDEGRISFGTRPDAKVMDPVCGMEVEPTRAAGSAEWAGERFYFCSPSCEAAFRADPQKYAQAVTRK